MALNANIRDRSCRFQGNLFRVVESEAGLIPDLRKARGGSAASDEISAAGFRELPVNSNNSRGVEFQERTGIYEGSVHAERSLKFSDLGTTRGKWTGSDGSTKGRSMMSDSYNMSMRKFLKQVGVTSQQAIEAALRDRGEAGKSYAVKASVTIEELGLDHEVSGTIVEND